MIQISELANLGLGHPVLTEAQAKIPKNPTLSTNLSIPNLARSNQF